MLAKDIIVAGNTIFVKVAHTRKKRIAGEKREARQKPTAEQVEKYNQKQAEKILAVIINHNFTHGDYHLVLTYSGEEPSREKAKEDLAKFKRDVTNLYRKEGITLKWVTATEYENKRIHHHIVMTGGIDIYKLAKKWKHGFIRPVHLDDTGDYRQLANYLIKETSKTFRESEAASKRRYNCSRTIEKPKMKREKASSSQLLNDPKPIPGYYIDPDSIVRGENPVTEQPYLEYVMISMSEEPRVKKWNRGKYIHRKETYKVNYDKQLVIPFRNEEAYS